jgi:DNA-binding LacI/PurR family transcriptional regulator
MTVVRVLREPDKVSAATRARVTAQPSRVQIGRRMALPRVRRKRN